MAATLDFRTVDIQKLVTKDMVSKENGNLSTTPLYDYGNGNLKQLCIQTPPVRLPFGLSDGIIAKNGATTEGAKPRYSVSGAFDKYREGGVMGEFFEFASRMETYAIHLAAQSSNDWLKKEYTTQDCDALMNRWIRVSNDEKKAAKYDPTFKATVREKKGQACAFWTECFDVDGSPMPLSAIVPGSKAIMKLKLTSFYVIAGKFGFTWEASWIRIVEVPTGAVNDYAPNTSENDDQDADGDKASPPPLKFAINSLGHVVVVLPPVKKRDYAPDAETMSVPSQMGPSNDAVAQKKYKTAGGNS